MTNLNDLPASNDDEFWGEAEKIIAKPTPIELCGHTKDNFMDGEYKDNGDGTASCIKCGWGFIRPGWIRIKDNKVVDLRILTGSSTSTSTGS
jgi:hypothetical protein